MQYSNVQENTRKHHYKEEISSTDKEPVVRWGKQHCKIWTRGKRM